MLANLFPLGRAIVSSIELIEVASPHVVRVILLSWSCWARTSTTSPKCARKSQPTNGCSTSAIVNRIGNDFLTPGLRVRSFCPYAEILVPLTACREKWALRRMPPAVSGEMTLTFEPVSIKNFSLVVLSKTWRRRLRRGQQQPLLLTGRWISLRFWMCVTLRRKWCTSRHSPWIVVDSSKFWVGSLRV